MEQRTQRVGAGTPQQQQQQQQQPAPFSLKVMRLFKPSSRNAVVDDVPSGDLSLPTTFGSVFAGQSFRCFVGVANKSGRLVKRVKVQTQLESPSKRLTLAPEAFREHYYPDESSTQVVNFDILEAGTHVLHVIVVYDKQFSTGAADERVSFTKRYPFPVLEVISLSMSIHPLQTTGGLAVQVFVKSLLKEKEDDIVSIQSCEAEALSPDSEPARTVATYEDVSLSAGDSHALLLLLPGAASSPPSTPKVRVTWILGGGERGSTSTSSI